MWNNKRQDVLWDRFEVVLSWWFWHVLARDHPKEMIKQCTVDQLNIFNRLHGACLVHSLCSADRDVQRLKLVRYQRGMAASFYARTCLLCCMEKQLHHSNVVYSLSITSKIWFPPFSSCFGGCTENEVPPQLKSKSLAVYPKSWELPWTLKINHRILGPSLRKINLLHGKTNENCIISSPTNAWTAIRFQEPWPQPGRLSFACPDAE